MDGVARKSHHARGVCRVGIGEGERVRNASKSREMGWEKSYFEVEVFQGLLALGTDIMG